MSWNLWSASYQSVDSCDLLKPTTYIPCTTGQHCQETMIWKTPPETHNYLQ